jgi:hypothetical protein
VKIQDSNLLKLFEEGGKEEREDDGGDKSS